ncbi:methyltransferase, FxLD system [Streptacidiphilus sp. MAP5-52]|uniref:methyltransferase, FxLD system n=1 Tax=Streptacidiphilus sp. MAP5-52 TaxID=3156267 RepID=UPI003518535D
MTTQSPAAESYDALREAMITELKNAGEINSPELEAAFRAVPRHAFAPEATAEEAYEPYTAVVTKRDEHGVSQSSVSAPQVQAFQIEQAEITAGMSVLEIGSGGYNAALMAELVGPDGQVTTVDIDPFVTERAARLLKETGYGQVRVLTADAESGIADFGPYDRIIVTVGSWDIPPSWKAQLAPDGRLVLPLRVRGLTRSVALAPVGDHLESRSARVCGFVAIQGADAHDGQLLLVNGTPEIGLRFDDEVMGNPSDLDNAVTTPRFETWTGVTLGMQEPFDSLQLWLATQLDGFCIMAVDRDLDSGIVTPVNSYFSMAAVDGNSFAYVTWRRLVVDTELEFGVHALGPQAPQLAQTISDHIRAWNQQQRGGPGPSFAVYPATTPDDQLPGGRVVNKRHSRILISWPAKTEG